MADILIGLKGNDERNFSNGGHQMVELLTIRLGKNELGYNAQVYSDYGSYTLEGVVPRCKI